ncbi:MAG TPA: choice-of-anchor D domain-containing protein, partial [Burkholderiaceae bacterium]|nr:choice-of-anchor D domain-containing protein [Burkholderiaceae bacterium]
MFNRLHFSAQGMLRAGAGLVLMVLGSGAMAQSAANGKVLYVDKFCATSGCHGSDPSRNENNIRNGANNAARILAACADPSARFGGMIAFCGNGKLSNVEAADLAAYIANPNFVGPLAKLTVEALAFRRSVNGNASSPQNVTLTNAGDANLVLTTVALGGNNAAEYKLVAPGAGATQCANGLSIAPKASCSVGITFDPSQAGPRVAELQISPDAASGLAAVKVVLNGTATAVAEPFPTADASKLDFGSQLLNIASGTKAVVVTNNGEATLTFDAGSSFFTLSGANAAEYTVDTAPSADGCAAAGTLAVGASCKLQLKFTPTATGSRAATLTINSNSTDVVVNLSGSGINADANDGGGGCSMIDPSKNSTVDPTLLGLGALALAVLGLRRR